MKLDRSEVLLLAHVLYHSKVTNAIDWDQNSKFEKLYKRLTSYLTGVEVESKDLSDDEVEDRTDFIDNLESAHEDGCPLQDEEDHGSEDLEEDDQQFDYSVSFSDLLKLEMLTVEHEGSEKLLKFVPGINSRTLDIEIDDDEVVCDVERVIRKENEIQLRTIMGWMTFAVENQPSAWKKLLPLGEVGSVERDQ